MNSQQWNAHHISFVRALFEHAIASPKSARVTNGGGRLHHAGQRLRTVIEISNKVFELVAIGIPARLEKACKGYFE